MILMERETVGEGIHRSGWPRVMQSLRPLATGTGILLDDFADATFSYQSYPNPHNQPWVGVFHHPVTIKSPLRQDALLKLRRMANCKNWLLSLPYLKGVITLCDEAAQALQRWLQLPMLTLMHPTEPLVPRWSKSAALHKRQLVQAGYCLRNTQLIYQIAPKHWERIRLFGATEWYQMRDYVLASRDLRPKIDPSLVHELGRLVDEAYDQLLSESVLVTELYGAAANNLLVECMVRGTPIVLNRLTAAEEYLGCDYPLFYKDLSQIDQLLEPARLCDASSHLLERAKNLPTFDQFALQVRDFVDSLDQ